MKQRNGRPPLWRALCLALSFALALSMVPSVGLAGLQTALAADGVSYQKATVSETTVTFSSDTTTSYTSLVNGNYSLNAGWYVVEGEVTINEPATTSGDVNLILSDGATVTFEEGIALGGKLTVYGQTNGTGKLIANGRGSSAGIGAASGASGASLEIHGGMVVATGGTAQFIEGGAGIGGGNEQKGFPVAVYGGTVTAKGGTSAAGIGGGAFADACDSGKTLLTVYGGNVTATGGYSGAGIGGGRNSNGGTVTINGGTVTANGGFLAQGIGRGRDSKDNSPSWQSPLASGTLTVGSEMHVYGGASQDSQTEIQQQGGAYGRYQYMYASQSELRTYDLWVGLTQVNDLNRNSLATNHWSFTPSSDSDKLGTLTLSGYDNNGSYLVTNSRSGESIGAAIYCGAANKKLTIVLEGTNNLTQESGGQTPRPGYAIYATGDLTIEGTGSLAATASSYAICVEDELDISGGTITSTGAGKVNSSFDDGYGGIYADDVTIEGSAVVNAEAAAIANNQKGTGLKAGSTLTTKGGTLTAKGWYGVDARVLYANNGSITADGTRYGITGWTTNIGNQSSDALGFLAMGGENAINPYGTTVTPFGGLNGQGWADKQGAGSGEVFNQNNLSSYKRIQFPSSAHFHNFTYTRTNGTNSATITATCSGSDCGLEGKQAAVTIKRPACTMYGDGKDENATVTGRTDILGMPTITYKKSDGTLLSDAPSDAGNYIASITLGGVTADCSYAIAQRPVTVKAKDQTVPVGGSIATGVDQVEITNEYLLNGHEIASVELTSSGTSNAGNGTITLNKVTIKSGAVDVTSNYDIHCENGKLTVTQAAPTVTAPTPIDLTYKVNDQGVPQAQNLVEGGSATGGTMQYAVGANGKTAPTDGWSNDVPRETDAGTYYVWYKVVGDGNYTSTTPACIPVTIGQATPEVNVPGGLTATYGQKLEDIASQLNSPSPSNGAWGWKDDDVSVGSVGDHTFEAIFTPNDAKNYLSVSRDVTVTVGRAPNPANVATTAVVQAGSTIDLADYVELSGASGDVTYQFDGDNHGCSLSGQKGSLLKAPSGIEPVDPVKVKVSIAQDSNFLALEPKQITVTITPNQVQVIDASIHDASGQEIPAGAELLYGATGVTIRAVAKNSGGTETGATITYVVKDGYGSYISVGEGGALTLSKVGTAYITVKAAVMKVGETTYAAASKDVKVTIAPAQSTPATVTVNQNLTYSGSPQELVTDGNNAVGGTMWYALGSDTEPSGAWSTTVPSATDAGTYYVWYKLEGDPNHADVAAVRVPVTIAKKYLTDEELTVPTATATYGQKLSDVTLPAASIPGTWAWTESADATVGNAGQNKHEAIFTPVDSNYNPATKDVTVTVSPADPAFTAPTPRSMTYTGSAQTLVNPGSTSDGAMYYALGNSEAPTDDWHDAVPTATFEGTYCVWYVVAGDANHNDSRPTYVTATIYPRSSGGGSRPSKVDKSELEAAIEEAKALDPDKYTPESVQPLDEAVAAGEAVLDDTKATQAKVDEATKAIKDAQAALVEKGSEPTPGHDVDKSELEAAIEAAKALDPEQYTPESAKALADAVAAGEEVLGDASATQAKVDEATQAIKDAQEALEEKGVEDGWKQAEDGTWSYVKNGARVTGWMQDSDGYWYHFATDGTMDTGWLLDTDGQWYYLSQEHDGRFGHLVSGWYSEQGYWYYLNESHDGTFGSLQSGWLWYRGFWYYLSERHDGTFGRMLTGWQKVGEYWYYLYPNPGAPQGSCALDTVIDGWRVDASGRWVA